MKFSVNRKNFLPKKSNKLKKYLKKYSYNINKVIGVDPFDFNNTFILENGVLSQVQIKEKRPEHLISTYIPNKNVITYELKLQKNLLAKIELEDYIETKCYEEVGLDDAEEYIFKHKIIDSLVDEKYLVVEVTIISKKDIEEYYTPIKKEYGYIDYISYSGYVFDVLYKENILEPQKDLFIYITNEEIVVTLYSDGKFLQTSVIPEGLENIYEGLIDSIKIKNFNYELFINLLIKKGLDLNNYSEKEHILFNELSELFSNKFLIISNQLNSIIRKFSLTTIDRIFMGTPKGIIPGISEFANMYLGVEANDLRFDKNYNINSIAIDQILFLSMLSAQYAYKKDDHIDNFTLFYRPPTFFYRKSGQFVSISVISFFLAILYPTYQFFETIIINQENSLLNNKLIELKHINQKLSKENKSLMNILKQKKTQKENLLKYIHDREFIVDTIYKAKKGYIPKALFLADISKYLETNNVYLKEIKFENQNLILDLYSNDTQHITSFIDDIVQKEHILVTTPGYKRLNDVYVAKVIMKVE